MENRGFRFFLLLLAAAALAGFLVVLPAMRPAPRLTLEVFSTRSNQWLLVSITNSLRSTITMFGNEDLDFGVYTRFGYHGKTVDAKTGGRPSFIVDLLPGTNVNRRLLIPENVIYVDATVEYHASTWVTIASNELKKRGYAKCADIVARCESLWPSRRFVSARKELLVIESPLVK